MAALIVAGHQLQFAQPVTFLSINVTLRGHPDGPQVKMIDMTRWSDLQPDVPSQRRTLLLSLVATIAGGVIGWSLLFAGLGFWGLALGAATALLIMVGIVRSDISQELPQLAGHGIAFVLLTWPLLWVAVGYVRYLLTGQSLGD